MLKNIGIVMVSMSFLVLILFVGELYLLRTEIQGAFDLATRIAVDQTIDQNSPDLPIDPALAQNVFLDVLQRNLNLDSSNISSNGVQRLQVVSIHAFEVMNVTDPTAFSASNPITGSVVTGSISQPSVLVMGVASVHLPFWPANISLPIFSVSGDYRPL